MSNKNKKTNIKTIHKNYCFKQIHLENAIHKVFTEFTCNSKIKSKGENNFIKNIYNLFINKIELNSSDELFKIILKSLLKENSTGILKDDLQNISKLSLDNSFFLNFLITLIENILKLKEDSEEFYKVYYDLNKTREIILGIGFGLSFFGKGSEKGIENMLYHFNNNFKKINEAKNEINYQIITLIIIGMTLLMTSYNVLGNNGQKILIFLTIYFIIYILLLILKFFYFWFVIKVKQYKLRNSFIILSNPFSIYGGSKIDKEYLKELLNILKSNNNYSFIHSDIPEYLLFILQFSIYVFLLLYTYIFIDTIKMYIFDYLLLK